MDLRKSLALVVGALAACTISPSSPPNFSPPPPSDLPGMSHVASTVRSDNVTITFDPVDGAKDYRVYVVPDGAADAGLPTTDVTYRCAGDREGPSVPVDNEPLPGGGAIQAFVNHDVKGYTRTTTQATLGYVYTDPGDGRVPVYALGDPAGSADNPCYFMRFDETRAKTFTTDAAQRQTLLSQGWRDFGIPFYAAAAGTAGTVQVYSASLSDAQLYFPSGPEQAARSGSSPAPAFLALAAQAPGTLPLMRVFYSNLCGKGHDELVAGQARFQHVERQGNTPITSLLWSGLKGPTTLAVEALDSGCPFQGHLSPVSFPAQTLSGVAHQAYLTLDQVRAADPNHEVFINGQHDGQPRPRAIARSFVQVVPQAPESWDFRDGFDADPGPFTEQAPTNLFETKRFLSSKYDVQVINVESAKLFGWGVVQGEFWVTYADSAADRNGKFRMTPTQKGTMSAGSFLHASMEVDLVSTNRRYPQILISNVDAPIQMISPLVDNMVNGTTVIVQPFDNYPSRLDIQVCDHRSWDVNDQCPRYKTDWASDGLSTQPPVPVLGELYGVDRRVRFDVWASTTKLYAMLDGQPMACANLAVGVPAGPATVTFGDVLYHSGADLQTIPLPAYSFHINHMQLETRRHFDELAFKSGVAAPSWDETKVPCSSTIQ